MQQPLGKCGEEIVSKKLQKCSHIIVHQNYRCRFGEIDIISRRKNTIYLTEVKTTSLINYDPTIYFERWNLKQKRKMVAAFKLFQLKENLKENYTVVTQLIVIDLSQASRVRLKGFKSTIYTNGI